MFYNLCFFERSANRVFNIQKCENWSYATQTASLIFEKAAPPGVNRPRLEMLKVWKNMLDVHKPRLQE